MKKTEKGPLRVEALVFLIPFIMAFCTIINGARFVQAEMLIHHAITQTAKQISTYSYVLTKAGITEKMQSTNGKSEEFTNTVEGAVSSIEGFAEAVGDPKGLVDGIFSLAKSEGEQYLMTQIAGTITRDNIENAIETLSDDPDEYLRNNGIVDGLSGLNFSKSKWNSNTQGKGNIEIIVTYEMENLLFPDFDFGSYHCSQSASTLIW